jgi:queuine tRNA-ribosyltransferase
LSTALECWTQASVDGAARAGTLATAHGTVPTPVFMPVGTQASVKGVSPAELSAAGARMILANAYHLYLRPGAALIEQAGGLHRFMSWDGAILTDSGGFQIFSLAKFARVDDEGYHFASHLDGSQHVLTPESVVAIQEQLGSDVAMVLDQLVPADVSEADAREGALRTLRWAERARNAARRRDQLTFAIVQGATHASVRAEHARALGDLDFPGYAIGGLWVGEDRTLGLDTVSIVAQALPERKPRYLMGVGTPEDVIDGIARGVDMFDCVYPTRCARHALALTKHGRLNLRNATFSRDFAPLDEDCDCAACVRFSRAYLAHLFRAGEMLAARLVSIHNIAFLTALVGAARSAIVAGGFQQWREQQMATLRGGEQV